MELLLTRTTRTRNTTIGSLTHNGRHICFILEDFDRGLHSSMPLAVIQRNKVYGKTCIPTGRYQVVFTWSPRFRRHMPLLLNVPGYVGIRIHAGNSAADTEGCLLPGTSAGRDWVNQSRIAYNTLLSLMQQAWAANTPVFITIQ